MVLFAGEATTETKDGKTWILHDGARHEVPAGKTAGITGSASAVAAGDLEGDGDVDLVAGDIDGNLWTIRNEGTPKEPAFAAPEPFPAGGKPARIEGGDAGPALADWDGDDVADLVVGGGDGGVTWFRNAGTRKEPRFEEGRVLVAPAKDGWETQDPAAPRPGVRAKVCVADWNGDGRPDLLLGDFAQVRVPQPEPSEERKKEIADLRAEQKEVSARLAKARAAMEAAANDPGSTPEAIKSLEEAYGKISGRWSEIHRALPREDRPAGHVWLHLRKPAAAR